MLISRIHLVGIHVYKEKVHRILVELDLQKGFALIAQSSPTTPSAILLFACLAVLVVWTIKALRNKGNHTDVSLAYEALSGIVVPASSAHPKQYQHLFIHSVTSKAVKPNFVELWKNITCGQIELKDKTALEELCLDKVCVFGQRISLDFDWPWKALALWRLVTSYLVFCWERLWHKQEGVEKTTVDIPNLASCLVNDTLDLDFVPLPYVGLALLAAQGILVPSETFDVEFTSLAPTTVFMSYHYLLCAAILLPNRHNISRSKKTALPFFISLPAIINNLSSSSVVVQAVRDISDVHADALEDHEHDMVFDKWMRSSFVARHGLDAWRETGLRLKWESALLKTGILVRWKITMCMAKQT